MDFFGNIMVMKIENSHGFSADIVLVEPEIPQNTGNIARTCAALGCGLHLIEPLGFSLGDRYLRRAGLDYWNLVKVQCYKSIDEFFETHKDGHFFFFTKKAQRNYYEADFKGRMYLFFGKETVGLPASITDKYPDNCFRIPMRPEARSLNLSNAVAIALYEAYRQWCCTPTQ